MVKKIVFWLPAVVGIIGSLFSPEAFSEGKISGLMFGDYYWFARSQDTTQLASEKGFKGQQGFNLRRVYFTYDYSFDDQWSQRFRLEANSKDFPTKTGTDFTAQDMVPYIKDAYLRYKWDSRNVFFGIISSPTWDVVEPHWGLRHVEKTPADLWKNFGTSSREFGLGVKGSYSDGLFGYYITLGNGAGQKHEINAGKKLSVSLTSAPIKEVILEWYGDYESNTHHLTSHVFGGYKTADYRAGLMYAYRKTVKAAFNDTFNIFSAYAAMKVVKDLEAFGRVDMVSRPGLGGMDYLRANTSNKPMLFLAGVEYALIKNASLSPNVEVVTYDGRDSDVVPRLTFSWKF